MASLSECKEGILTIETSPCDMNIYVDGHNRGSSPLNIYNLRIGRIIEVRAEKLGYKTIKEKIKIDRDAIKKHYSIPYAELKTSLFLNINCPITKDSSNVLAGFYNYYKGESFWQRISPFYELDCDFRLFGASSLEGKVSRTGIKLGMKSFLIKFPCIGRTCLGFSGFWEFSDYRQPTPFIFQKQIEKIYFTTHLNFRPFPNTICNFSVASLMDVQCL